MKKILFIFCFLAWPLRAENVDPTQPESMTDPAPPVLVTTGPLAAFIRIVHPKEGAALPAVKSSFVYGWSAPGGKVSVNGAPAHVHPEGGFLCMVNYAPGTNVLRVSYEKEGVMVATDRRVTVAGGGGEGSSVPEIIRPDLDVAVQPGEPVEVYLRAAPGGRAFFQIEGVQGKRPLQEAANGYRGYFIPRGDDDLSRSAVKVFYEPLHGKKTALSAPGRVSVVVPTKPWVVEVSTDLAILRAGPGLGGKDKAGYVAFPPLGTRLRVTGRRGDELRVRLGESRTAWIGREEVKDLSSGTPSPLAIVHGASVLPAGPHSLVRLSVSQKVPFEVIPTDDLGRLDVRFFGAVSNTDWIHLSTAVPWVRQLRWFQDSPETYRLTIETEASSWWGYDARYENNAFVLELRRPPVIVNPGLPLEGLTVAVDAGHSSDPGATGVTGVLEKDLNQLIAECLKKKLEAERAKVVMIREGGGHVPLYDRPKAAWAAKADVLVSVHNNALPEGDNPFERRGFGVYYFHPASLPLARAVHQSYVDVFGGGRNSSRVALRDDGLHWGNLALPRTPQMPAILTESAYLTHPDEEWWLRQPTFQCDCAEAMLQGLRRYAKKMRPAK